MAAAALVVFGGGPFLNMYLQYYIPWIGSIAVELALIFVILVRRHVRRFPFFLVYVVFDLLRAILLPAVATAYPNTNFYSTGYWLCVPVEYALTLLVLIEMFLHVFGGPLALSRRTVHSLIGAISLLVVVCVAIILHPDTPTNNLSGVIVTVNRSIKLLMCGLMIFIWVFAKRLNLSWGHHVWGIALGFGLYSGVGLAVSTVLAATGKLCINWLSPVPHFAYVGAAAIWTAHLIKREPEREPLTQQEIGFYTDVIEGFRNIAVEVRRTFHDRYKAD